MIERAFVDSNVFLYASDKKDSGKRVVARKLIHSLSQARSGVVSVQVVNEYMANAMHKLHLAAPEVLGASRMFDGLELVSMDLLTSRSALEIHSHHQINFWDALIVASAVSAGCKTLYTEDLSHGHTIAGLRIVDPFA